MVSIFLYKKGVIFNLHFVKIYKLIAVVLSSSILFVSCLATNTTTENINSKAITNSLNVQHNVTLNSLYPTGAYRTFNDFAKRAVTDTITFTKSQLKHIRSANYQLLYNNGKRVKEPFAVSNGTELFVSVKKLKKYFNGSVKGKLSEINNDYLLAYYVNDKFLYFEDELVYEYVVAEKFIRYGILYNSSTQKFIILDKGSKINAFLKKYFPGLEGKYNFIDKNPNLNKVRMLMADVFNVK